MRLIALASVLVAALAISATAHATPVTYFGVSVAGGPSLSFTLDPSKMTGVLPGMEIVYSGLTFSDHSTGRVVFFDPGWANSRGFGPIDFQLVIDNGFSGYFEGSRLYTGSESDPTFIPDTYHLDGDPITGTTDSVVLTIGQTPVPEPSSQLLLGTGVLGCGGALRRRFVKA